MSGSASGSIRGRVMAFAYLPVNLGTMVGPAIGAVVTRSSVFAVFPVAAVMMLLGVVMLVVAMRTKAEESIHQAT